MSHQVTVLSNGLTIVTAKMAEIVSVTINIMVKVGSRYEELHNSGISHFLEHMAFKGTAKRTAKQIAEEFDNIGGYFNAYTGREHTVYTVKVLEKDMDIALDILADILQNSLFQEEELKRELNVILQELAQSEDTPDDIIFDYFQETAFSGQAIGKSILGCSETISNFNDQTFRDYVSEYYRGPNMILSAVGNNINHQDVVILTEKLFNKLASNYQKKIEPALYKGGACYKNRDLEQIHFIIGFQGISYHHDDLYNSQILSSILGGGMSSRLFQEIREKRGLAYSVGSYNSFYADNGIFGIYSATSENDFKESCDIICDQILKITQHIGESELKRAQSQIKAGILMSQESSSFRTEELARNYALYGRHIPIEEIIKNIDEVTCSSVENYAKRIFFGSKPTITALGKINNVDDYDKICGKLKS